MDGGVNTQGSDERRAERSMDDYLRSLGLHRKKIAKDGSCLFRAVAEQVTSGLNSGDRMGRVRLMEPSECLLLGTRLLAPAPSPVRLVGVNCPEFGHVVAFAVMHVSRC